MSMFTSQNKNNSLLLFIPTFIFVSCITTTLLLLQPFYGPLDFVRDYPGEPVPDIMHIVFK